jgi:ubiquinone/menaquinone biosynthesis C-methylase UbiE
MKPNLAQWTIELLNRFCGPRNPYFETMMRSDEEAFEYAVRAGNVVYQQFAGWNDFLGRVVLDFGCGIGGKTVFYATQGPRWTIGVDRTLNTHRAVDYARAHGLAVQFMPLGRYGRIPLPDNTCDVVITSSVLEHVEDLPGVLRELRRVLKPRGLLLNRWHPYRSRYGAHLWAAIGIPFAHLLFREADLVQVYYRTLVKRLGKVPSQMGNVDAHSRSFTDLAYTLNRRSVRELSRAVEAAGFEIRQRRHFWNTRQVGYTRLLPRAWIDYVIDYEVQVCVNHTRVRLRATAPSHEKLLSWLALGAPGEESPAKTPETVPAV